MKNRIVVMVASASAVILLLTLLSGWVRVYAQDTDQQRDQEYREWLIRFYEEDFVKSLKKEIGGLLSPLQAGLFKEWIGVGITIALITPPAEFENKSDPFGSANVFVGYVFKNSPAGKAGMQNVDTIVKVNSENFGSLDEFLQKIRGDGKAGHNVALRVFREGGWRNFKMKTSLLGVPAHKQAEAFALEIDIRTSGKVLINEIEKILPVVVEKMKLNPNIESPLDSSAVDPDFTKLRKAYEKFQSWRQEYFTKVDDFIEMLQE